MTPSFDIFMRLPDGHPLWIRSFADLEEARKHLKQVARDALGDCFIYSEETGVVELIPHSAADVQHQPNRPSWGSRQ